MGQTNEINNGGRLSDKGADSIRKMVRGINDYEKPCGALFTNLTLYVTQEATLSPHASGLLVQHTALRTCWHQASPFLTTKFNQLSLPLATKLSPGRYGAGLD